ncbi:MAG: hypothetical protein JO110_24440, partial [Acetobacteraceae bacterium]|nr:hypothetical protein [Acetobacteraceae bacterium]
MFEFLPRSLRRLYRAILNPTPFARSTRVRTEPEPEPKPEEITSEARERIFRVEIIQDAYYKQRPAPKRLFKKPTFHRRMEAWCERRGSHWGSSRCSGRYHCENCAEARDLYVRALRGEWQAECRLHRRAQRGALKLLAERGQYEQTKRRLRYLRIPADPPKDPGLFASLGWARWRERRAADPGLWFVLERREAEARLLKQHARKLQRCLQRKRARLRDEARGKAREA